MEKNQTTSSILMVRPANFGFNTETAANNAFQVNDTSLTVAQIQQKAIAEFDNFVALLRGRAINVVVAEDTSEPVKTKYDQAFVGGSRMTAQPAASVPAGPLPRAAA